MVSLRRLVEEDAPNLAKLLNNINIVKQLRDFIPFPYSEEDARNFIGFVTSDSLQKVYAIEVEEVLVGVVGLVLQEDIYKLSAELGYWLGEAHWNKGIMTQAVKEILKRGFNEFKLLRIYSGVKQNNKGSQRVLEKAGFKLEGVFKKAIVKNGLVMDEYRYAILNSDFSLTGR